jgi:hypothetical protein
MDWYEKFKPRLPQQYRVDIAMFPATYFPFVLAIGLMLAIYSTYVEVFKKARDLEEKRKPRLDITPDELYDLPRGDDMIRYLRVRVQNLSEELLGKVHVMVTAFLPSGAPLVRDHPLLVTGTRFEDDPVHRETKDIPPKGSVLFDVAHQVIPNLQPAIAILYSTPQRAIPHGGYCLTLQARADNCLPVSKDFLIYMSQEDRILICEPSSLA